MSAGLCFKWWLVGREEAKKHKLATDKLLNKRPTYKQVTTMSVYEPIMGGAMSDDPDRKTKQHTNMKNETITIEAPEGHVIDKENSTDTVIRFKKVESNKGPMSWMSLKEINGYYINSYSEILPVDANVLTHYKNRNIYPSKKLAEAALALSQLLQLRDAWNECNTEEVAGRIIWHGITNQNGEAVGLGSNYRNMPLRFKTEETRDAFFKQFRPLIETALPLL